MTMTIISSILIFCSGFFALIIHGDEHYGEYSSKKFEKAANNVFDKKPRTREFLSFITEAIVIITIVVSFFYFYLMKNDRGAYVFIAIEVLFGIASVIVSHMFIKCHH